MKARVNDYREVMRAEMSPDVYDGPQCDQVRPRWYGEADGDMGGEYVNGPLQLDPKTFPPGTQVIVLEPECDQCGQVQELCRGDESCDFDWDGWVMDEFS